VTSVAPLAIAMVQRFLPSRSRGGVGHFTHGLANALMERDHAVTVFSQDPAPGGARYRVVQVGDRKRPAGSPGAPLLFPVQIARQDFSPFDILHAQGDDQLIPRSDAPPVVRTLHGSALAEAVHNGLKRGSAPRFLMHLYFYAWERVAAARADVVVAVSADTRGHHPRVHRVVPNGVDLQRFAPRGDSRAANPTILFVGELSTRKRGALLVEAFRATVRPAIPGAELWLVCPERVEGDGIRWHETVDDDALARLYRQAWVFCLPSSYEGFGRPYVEALAAGTPVVATPNAGALEVLGNGRYGVIAEDHELGPALCAVLNDPARREVLSRRGLERVGIYAWERIAREYEEVYEGALVERRRERPAPAAGRGMR
jgi:phosphatidyl-myo-inositol alpha-mannosyltransferase